jgi:4-alpha-glucanotransferase
MKLLRASGVLLHPTSLPSSGGIGDLGPDAFRFVDFLAEAGFKIWQMLPLGPTGFGDSPYQCFSAFAGNPMLIHLPGLAAEMVQTEQQRKNVDFGAVIEHKRTLLRQLFDRFVPDERFERWTQQQPWLEDFALFTAIKSAHNGIAWTAWEPALAAHDAAALVAFRASHEREIAQVYFEQYVFYRQYEVLRRACVERGIQVMGDLPIYVAHDSADVWSNRDLFQLDEAGQLIVQAGVPPDYFSETGQLWGNPIYNWGLMKARGYQWWIDRMRAAFATFDVVRLDHFRGFESYWEVPGNAPTAVNGRWAPGPGAGLFEAITLALGALPIVAENLGLITPEVEALRERLDFPGMSILQFAFAGDGTGGEFKPHNFPRERVVYTGTHDNDTTLGWWNASAGIESTRSASDIQKEKAYARSYLNTDGAEMNWTLIRAALASVANTALIPMQDILGLGSEARMNLPGRKAGNWTFRFTWEQLTPDIAARLRELTRLYDR